MPMICVTVHLHTVLQRSTAEGPVRKLPVTLPPGSTLADLIEHLGIEFPTESLLHVVNGRLAQLDQTLHDGDKVNLMPAMSGG
jgi:sulfur carrier protein ThiS